MDDINTLRRILGESRILAVVGLSADWFRPSYFAAKYMQEHGYRVIPVNPKYDSILGEKCYKSLRDIPEKIDLVDVFRKTQALRCRRGSMRE
jgi:predicted CoA-binding protein